MLSALPPGWGQYGADGGGWRRSSGDLDQLQVLWKGQIAQDPHFCSLFRAECAGDGDWAGVPRKEWLRGVWLSMRVGMAGEHQATTGAQARLWPRGKMKKWDGVFFRQPPYPTKIC
jgi:hypothetical protein